MKIFGLIFLLLMFFTISNAQWQKQNVDTKASLRGLSVVSEKVIWASGTGGTVLRSVDGGKNWSVLKVPDAEKLDFRDIEAFDADTAYILSIGTGESSRIYKTTDGGKTWKLQFKNTNEKAFFDAFAFWDANHGIAMSDPVDGKYLLLETTDGETWKPLDNAQMPNAKDGEAAFAASGTCIITRGKEEVFLISGGSDARVFYSKDRGKSWTVTNANILKGKASQGAFSIAFADKKRGIIVGGDYAEPEDKSGNVSYTKDGGKTWQTKLKLNDFGYRSGAAFVDKKTVVIVGSNGSNISTDGGEIWREIDKENYNAVQAKGKNSIWAVGANGLMSKFQLKK